MTTYTAYRFDVNTEKLSHRENLGNLDELNQWLASVNHPSVKIVQDATGKERIGTQVQDEAGNYYYHFSGRK